MTQMAHSIIQCWIDALGGCFCSDSPQALPVKRDFQMSQQADLVLDPSECTSTITLSRGQREEHSFSGDAHAAEYNDKRKGVVCYCLPFFARGCSLNRLFELSIHVNTFSCSLGQSASTIRTTPETGVVSSEFAYRFYHNSQRSIYLSIISSHPWIWILSLQETFGSSTASLQLLELAGFMQIQSDSGDTTLAFPALWQEGVIHTPTGGAVKGISSKCPHFRVVNCCEYHYPVCSCLLMNVCTSSLFTNWEAFRKQSCYFWIYRVEKRKWLNMQKTGEPLFPEYTRYFCHTAHDMGCCPIPLKTNAAKFVSMVLEFQLAQIPSSNRGRWAKGTSGARVWSPAACLAERLWLHLSSAVPEDPGRSGVIFGIDIYIYTYNIMDGCTTCFYMVCHVYH